MSKRVLEVPLHAMGKIDAELPARWEFIGVVVDGKPKMLIAGDPKAPIELRTFFVLPVGGEVPIGLKPLAGFLFGVTDQKTGQGRVLPFAIFEQASVAAKFAKNNKGPNGKVELVR